MMSPHCTARGFGALVIAASLGCSDASSGLCSKPDGEPDPSGYSWCRGADTLVPHMRPVAAKLKDGRVLVAGGNPTIVDGANDGTGDAEIFDPTSNRWSKTA